MVFQEYNLVERLAVMENLLSGRLSYVSAWRAWRRKFSPEDIRRRSSSSTSSASPDSPSAPTPTGGQRQRVGIARAVMRNLRPSRRRADLLARSETSVEIMELLVDMRNRAEFRCSSTCDVDSPALRQPHRRHARRSCGLDGASEGSPTTC
jgi:phosphonate transport system ATP-binding protein